MYLSGGVKVDCPGPKLCNQQKCKTGEKIMTLYVFGYDEDDMAGARTLLMALKLFSTMGDMYVISIRTERTSGKRLLFFC